VLDPLEEASSRLIELGHGVPQDIAQTLQLDVSLVHSALESLEKAGRIRQEGERWLLEKSLAPVEAPREREGWVIWDSLARRPLLQLILGAPPLDDPQAPRGWEIVACEAGPEFRQRPSGREMERALSFLTDLPELEGLERMGSGLRGFEGGQVRRIRRNPRLKSLRRSAYIPVEFRPGSGPVLWRPCVFPFEHISSEFDSSGWEGLLKRVDAEGRQQLETRELEANGAITPFVLQETGFQSMNELRKSASQKVRYSLVDVWDEPGWEVLQRMVVDAEVFSTLAHAVKHSSQRQALHCWADVLEALVGLLTHRLEDAFTKERFEEVLALSADVRRQRVGANLRVLREGGGHLRGIVANEQELKRLRKQLESQGTIGIRLMGLAFALVFVPAAGPLLERALDVCPSFFDELSQANQVRTRVVHPDVHAPDEAESIDLDAFRQRILAIVRAVMHIPMQ
jgi:hypothetical protein